MSIKTLFKNLTEDKRYEIGQISEKTGLEKTANGWVVPKNGKGAGSTHEEEKKPAAAPAAFKLEEGAPVKVKGGRTGEIRGIRPGDDKALVFMHAEGGKPAGSQVVPLSDLEATGPAKRNYTFLKAGRVYSVSASSPKEALETLRSKGVRGFKESDAYNEKEQKAKEAAKKAKQDAEVKRQRDEGEANAEAYRKRYEAEHAAPKQESMNIQRIKKDFTNNFWTRPEDFEQDVKSHGWDVEEMNNEYAVISNDKGSQYEMRFDDHGDDGDLSVRTIKPLMIDEDDDDTDDAAPITGETKIRLSQIRK